MNTTILLLTLGLACGDKADDTSDATHGADGGSSDGDSSSGSDGDGNDGGDDDGGTDQDGGESVEPEVHEIDPDTLAEWLAAEAEGGDELLLINTHTPNAGEIPGTDTHVVYSEGDQLAAAVGDDQDRLTVVYCKTGPMSATAAQTLVAAGYTAIWDMPAGMNGWEAAGYELAD